MSDKEKEVPELTDILELFNKSLEGDDVNIVKPSLKEHFKTMIEDSLYIESESETIVREQKQLEEAYDIYSRRTRGRVGRRLKKAKITSVSGGITSNVASNVTVTGENFYPKLGQLFVLFEGGGTSASSSGTSNAAGTQVTVAVPEVTYSLNSGTSVGLFVLPANKNALKSEETITINVLAPCPGGG